MRLSPIISLLLLGSVSAFAQADQYVISRQGSVTLSPYYQSWSAPDAGYKFSESSLLLSAYIPAGRNLSFSLRGGGAVSGGDVPKLNGLTDLQAGASYHLESANTVFSLGLNLPVGKKELSPEEFATGILFSYSLFHLQVPVFGQGFNVNPGIAWVFPVSDIVVLGLAAAYQYRGEYTPVEGQGKYAPGGEFTANAGADFRLSESASLSTDFMLTVYGTDKYDGQEVFASGNSYWVNVQYKQFFREHELQIFAGYRTTSKPQVAGVGGLVDARDRLEPGRFDLLAQFRQVFGPRFSLGYLAQVRVFEETTAPLSGAKVVGVALLPVISTGGGLSFPVRLRGEFGKLAGGEKITGFEAGVGIAYTF